MVPCTIWKSANQDFDEFKEIQKRCRECVIGCATLDDLFPGDLLHLIETYLIPSFTDLDMNPDLYSSIIESWKIEVGRSEQHLASRNCLIL